MTEDAGKLEELWAGEFGDAYVERNAATVDIRRGFWSDIVDQFPARNALEVGCAAGANLQVLSEGIPANQLWGSDVNTAALTRLQESVPGVNATWGVARDLPFRDRWFDLVFTVGLLIHQPDATLPLVMSEIVRCSRRWILWGEYHAEEQTQVQYRGLDGVLFKRDYGHIYQDLFPELTLRAEGFLTKEQGFDRVTWQVFERPS
jgi:pseudaminic acid biosynthesis-associated methylase